ncbi:small GTP-binding protein [Histomonas meleagridis]|uniref:small GTP-binding protein n=1 Tax=Histomonas meleagridis TaxID=135588 RepID=UPI00355A0F1B|nr:small GTP-binding protein [Histomonas meleagridis]KAH0806255.1 small GTP-binding protein [Histomonas meleagridis]
MTETEGLRPIKIILVGPSGVGKTTLINTFFEQPYEKNTQTTVAPAFCETTIEISEDCNVTLHIWDTAGQEKYQSVVGMFYRDSDIAFVCFDEENLNAENISIWVNRVLSQVPECLIFIVLTKEDTLTTEQVSKICADSKAYIKKYKAEGFYVTSASTGNGVKELFLAAGKCAHKICGKQIPTSVEIENNNQDKGCNC